MDQLPLKNLHQLGEAYAHMMTAVFAVADHDVLEKCLIVLANPGAAKLVGVKSDFLVGTQFYTLFDQADQKRVLATLEAGKDLGIYSEFNLKITRKSGRVVIVNLAARKMSNSDGDFIIFNLHDVTELHRAHEELEQRVQLRTADLYVSKNRILMILNSSLQGFITFNEHLKIEPEFSIRAIEFLGPDLEGQDVCSVLNLNPEIFRGFCDLVFQNKSWDLIQRFSTMDAKVGTRDLKVELRPVIDGHTVKRILGTITDVTQMKALEQNAESTAREGRTLFKVLQSKHVFLDMLESIAQMSLVDCPQDREVAARYAHTLKGEFAFFECREFVEICHFWEEKWQKNPGTRLELGDFSRFMEEIRVQLDDFMLKYRSILNLNQSNQAELTVSLKEIQSLIQTVIAFKSKESILQSVERLVEVPIDEYLAWLSETWLMVVNQLGKKAEPLVWKKTLSLFIAPYKNLFATFVHAVRNSADHGLELPKDRLEAGKPEKGSLVAEMELIGDTYYFRLKDDGKGIQLKAIQLKAKELGIPVPEAEEKVRQLLFESRVSTSQTVTSLSGRGIGLGAIRAEAIKLGGGAEIAGEAGVGLELSVWFKKVGLYAEWRKGT